MVFEKSLDVNNQLVFALNARVLVTILHSDTFFFFLDRRIQNTFWTFERFRKHFPRVA